MTIKSIWLRRIHKWVGLIIGVQFLLWAISGTAMALLNMEEVAGGEVKVTRPDESRLAKGLHGLTRTMARDLGQDKIRVNTVVPGWVMPCSGPTMCTTPCLPLARSNSQIAARPSSTVMPSAWSRRSPFL